jgi:hypothetical protein
MIFILSPIPSIDYSVILAKRGSKAATPAFEKVRSIGMTHLAGQDYFYTGECIAFESSLFYEVWYQCVAAIKDGS